MSTLPYRIIQSDGGDLKVLATVADEIVARALFSALIEDLFDQKGTQPTVWLEEWLEDRWVLADKVEIDKQRKLYAHMMDGIPTNSQLLWRRLTDREQDVVIRALEQYTDKLKASMHMETRRTYLRVVQDNSMGYDATKKKIESTIFDPWDRIHQIDNLTFYLRRNPILVESELYLPEQL